MPDDQAPTPPRAPVEVAPTAGDGSDGLNSAVRSTSGMTLLSRLGGLAREILVARIFGDTAIGSAFAAGFQIPNLFRRLFGEGALSAAFIPEYSQAHKHDPDGAGRLASLIVLLLAAATTGLMVVIQVGLLIAMALLPADADRNLSFGLIIVMLPFMPLVCCVAIMGGMLQVHGRFGPAASGPLVLNGFLVSVGLYYLLTNQLGSATTAYVLGIATVLSGVTQLLWFARLLRPHVRWTRDFTGTRDRARRIGSRFIPAAIGLGTLQINTFVDTLLAMWPNWVGTTMLGYAYPMDEASNAILSGATRLYQFPLGVFGIAVATAVFPLLSRTADEPAKFAQTLRRGIRLSLFIGIPASVGLWLVRGPAIEVPYSGGAGGFSAEGVQRAAAVLGGFAPAVWAYSLNHVLTRAFYAKGDTRTPMRIGMAMVAVNLACNLVSIWWLREAGLAWSTSISATLQVIVLLWIAHRAGTRVLQPGERVLDTDVWRAIARIVAATALMAAAVWLVGYALLYLDIHGWRLAALRLAAMAAAGIGIYVGVTWALRSQELRWLLRR